MTPCVAMADFIDVKSPFTLGHSRAVADACRGVGRGGRVARPWTS